MMNWLLVTLLFIMCYCSYFINGKTYIAPPVIVSGVMLASAIIVAINTSYWEYIISFDTVVVIVVSVLMFIFGYSLCNHLRIKQTLINSLPVETYNLKTPSKKFYVFCLIYATLVLLLFFRQQYNNALRAGFSSSLSEIVSANRLVKDETIENSSFIRLLFVCLKPIAYILLVIYIMNREKGVNEHKVLTFLVIIIYAMCCVLTSNRGDLLAMASTIIFLILFFNYKKKNWSYKASNVSTKFKVFLIFAVAIGGFRLLGYLTGKSNMYSFYDNICVYLGSPIVCLDRVVTGTANLRPGFHVTLVTSLLRMLNSVGIHIDLTGYVTPHQYWTSQTGRWGSNIYTSLFPFYINYGLVPLFISEFIFGSLYSILWNSVKSGKGSWTSFIIYADMFFYYICMFSIAERFFSQFFTLTSMVEIAVIAFIVKQLVISNMSTEGI